MPLLVSPGSLFSFLCTLASPCQSPTGVPRPCAGKMGRFPSVNTGGGLEEPEPQEQSTWGSRCPSSRCQPPGSCSVSLIFPVQVSRFCPEKTDLKDYALPNASWCPDMLDLYQEFLEKTKTDGWIKLPSFKSNRDHIQGLKLPSGLAVASGKAQPGGASEHTCSPAYGVGSAGASPCARDPQEGAPQAPFGFPAGSSCCV